MGLKSYAATDGNDVKDLSLTFSVDRPAQEEDNGNQEEKRGLVVCVQHAHRIGFFCF